MSVQGIGTLFVKAALEAGGARLFSDVRAEMFTDEERPLFTFVENHLRRYSALPSMHTVTENGFQLPPRVPEVPTYYVDRLRSRHAFNGVNGLQADYRAAMEARDMGRVTGILEQMLVASRAATPTNRVSTMQAQMAHVSADYEYAKAHPGLRGIPLGWETLNDMTSGAAPADLIVFAGRPGMGKTYDLMKCCHTAWRANFNSLFVSLEMPLLQIGRRWVGLHSRMNPRLIHKGQLSMFGEEAMHAAIREIENSAAPVHLVSGDSEKRVEGIGQLAYQLSPDIIFIDAAYLLERSLRQKGGASRWEELTMIMHDLRALAIALNRPIVISVQFNRNQKQSSTGEPDLRDLGGTDAIGQDATIVVTTQQGRAPRQKTSRIKHVLKNREGEVGAFATSFTFQPMCFDEIPYTPDGEEEAEDPATAQARREQLARMI